MTTPARLYGGTASALALLSRRNREVLVECYYGRRSVAEAAVRLGASPAEVKSRLYYALRSLRLALEEAALEEAGLEDAAVELAAAEDAAESASGEAGR